jgi:secreted trypsin-like serine protease
VAKDVVLTAAHCIKDKKSDPLPTSGSVQIKRHDLNSNDGEEIKVKRLGYAPQL